MIKTITRNKGEIIGLLILIGTICAVIFLAASAGSRAKARAEADRIISGEQQATERQVRKIITRLVAAKSWTRYSTEVDTQRVELLCNMRNEMRKSQLQAHSVKVREQADRIISGKEQATEEQITEIIFGLSFPKSWPQRLIAQDRQRLQQLQNMHNAMGKSRHQAYIAKVREQADRIISGEEPATVEQINKIITSLQISTPWPEGHDRTYYQQMQQLNKIRKEMVTPHD